MKDVVIVGGGIMGLLSAYELAGEGLTVTVFDRGASGMESTWAGGGILSPLYPWRYADAVTELARWSQARYQAFSESLLAETGRDPEWTRSGLLMLDVEGAERRQAGEWAARFGYQLEYLAPAEVAGLGAELSPASGTSLWMPEVAQVRNPRFLDALRAAAEKKGVTIREHSPVSAIDSREGRVTGVRCGEGSIAADRVILCGGAWSGEILKQLGVVLPIRPVRGQMLLFTAAPGLLQQIVLSGGYYLIPRRDGRILVGSTLEEAGFDKSTTDGAREELLAAAYRILPALREAALERQWAGLRPGSPNGIPFIGPVPAYEGLYVNAGQYRNGVVTGLASAKLITDIVLGRQPELDAQAYKLP